MHLVFVQALRQLPDHGQLQSGVDDLITTREPVQYPGLIRHISWRSSAIEIPEFYCSDPKRVVTRQGANEIREVEVRGFPGGPGGVDVDDDAALPPLNLGVAGPRHDPYQNSGSPDAY